METMGAAMKNLKICYALKGIFPTIFMVFTSFNAKFQEFVLDVEKRHVAKLLLVHRELVWIGSLDINQLIHLL